VSVTFASPFFYGFFDPDFGGGGGAGGGGGGGGIGRGGGILPLVEAVIG